MRGVVINTIGSILGATLLIWLFPGCVAKHAHVQAPSNAKVQGNINNAQSANAEAQGYNAQARSRAKRIEDKVIVIQKNWQE